MGIIYQPRGPAYEYSKYAANLYKGCFHGCKYCFAPSATFTDRETFHSEDYIRPRKDVIDLFKKDCIKYANQDINVLLSFTTDTYQPIEKELGITRIALELLVKYNIPFTVLTKADSYFIKRDLDLFKSNPKNAYAITLTCSDNEYTKFYEPNAASHLERIECLKIAHDNGINTWCSLEPVLDPQMTYELIKLSYKYVDLYKVGKTNHCDKRIDMDFQDIEISKIDWKLFKTKVINLLDSLDCKYIIKDDLLKA